MTDALLSNLPVMAVIVIAVVIVWYRLNDLIKRIDSMTVMCEKRLMWCIDHFSERRAKNADG